MHPAIRVMVHITLGAVTGGIAPYIYSINGGAFTNTLTYTNLPAGNYNVIVQDVNGCIFNAPTTTVNNVGGPTNVQVAITDATCGNNDGSITLGNATGGVGPYTFELNIGGFSTTTVYNNLAPGNL